MTNIDLPPGPIRLWVDDLRPAPEGYNVTARSCSEALEVLRTGRVTDISLDHDLGNDRDGTGYDVACMIERKAYFGILPKLVWKVHSQNSVGSRRIAEAMARADSYWTFNSKETPQ